MNSRSTRWDLIMTVPSSNDTETGEQLRSSTGLVGYLAVLVWGIVVCLVVITIFQYEWFLDLGKGKELYVKLAPIGFCVLVILALVLTQYWSVAVISNLRGCIKNTAGETRFGKRITKYFHISEDVEGDRLIQLSERGCVYCGNAVAPLVCSKCGAVQWPDLTRQSLRENYGLTRAGLLWGYAVFFGHHRFKIFAGVLAIAVIGVLGFSMETRLLRHNRADAQITDARQVLDHLLGYRSGLAKIRIICSSENKEGVASFENYTSQPICTEMFRQFIDSYYAFTWSAPDSLAHLNEIQCAQFRSKKSLIDEHYIKVKNVESQIKKKIEQLESELNNKTAQTIKQANSIKELKHKLDITKHDYLMTLACEVAIDSAKSVEYLDGCFRAIVQSFGKNDKDALEAAHELYRKGRAIGCVIDPLTHPEQQISPSCEPDIKGLIAAMKMSQNLEKREGEICHKYKALNFKPKE